MTVYGGHRRVPERLYVAVDPDPLPPEEETEQPVGCGQLRGRSVGHGLLLRSDLPVALPSTGPAEFLLRSSGGFSR